MSKEVIKGYVCSETAESIKDIIQKIIDGGLVAINKTHQTISLDICDDPVIYPEEGCCREMCKEIEITIKVKGNSNPSRKGGVR